MCPQELRIGNYVFNENKEVVEIIPTRLCLFDDGKVQYKPIRLTDEYLLKFGFILIKYKGIEIYKNNLITECILYKNIYYYIEGLRADIEYVHQFQNIIYAVYGYDLNLG